MCVCVYVCVCIYLLSKSVAPIRGNRCFDKIIQNPRRNYHSMMNVQTSLDISKWRCNKSAFPTVNDFEKCLYLRQRTFS